MRSCQRNSAAKRLSPLEFKKSIERRLRKFAVATFKFLDGLPKSNSSRIIAYQLGKSASSVGANYHEANRSESRDDFCHKLSISLKEASESNYWLEILSEMYQGDQELSELYNECQEILRLLQSITRSARSKKTTQSNDQIAPRSRAPIEQSNNQTIEQSCNA